MTIRSLSRSLRLGLLLLTLSAIWLGIAVPKASAVLTVTRGSDRDPYASRIVVTEDDGSKPRVLGPGATSAISPDGTMVAVGDYGPSGEMHLVLYSIGGKSMWSMVLDGGGPVEWSPDSRQLVVTEGSTSGRLLLVEAASGEQRILVDGRDEITGESFSPDSSELAYTTKPANDWGGPLRVIDVQTGSTRTLRTKAEAPVWGSAGIAFSTLSQAAHSVYPGDRNVWNVARIDPDGSGYRQLSHIKIRDRFFGLQPLGWSGDGAHIAAAVIGADGEWLNTWVVDARHGGAKLLARGVEATAVSSDGKYVIGQNGDPECCGFKLTDIVRMPWTPTRGKPHVLVPHAMLASSSSNVTVGPEPEPSTPALPAPKITAAAPPTTAGRGARFAFVSDLPAATFECRLEGDGVGAALSHWRPCASPQSYAHLSPGAERFSVRAVEGGRRSAPTTREWTILKPGSAKPVILPVSGGSAVFHATCPLAERCRERVEVEAGGKELAHGRYSVPAHGDRHVQIPLTGTGGRLLAHRSQVAATLVLENLRTHRRAEIAVLLERR